jgi:carboxylate-amine ligase
VIVEQFRGSAGPSLGVELEFQLVDAASMVLTGVAEGVLAGIPAWARDAIKPEFYDCCVEVNTGICRDVADVGRDLAPRIAATARAAAAHRACLAWGGTHPFSHWRDQPVVPTPRYLELAEHYRETLCRQVTFGLHVHVGVADGDTAVRVCNGIAEHLPALLALSANSPFWCGRATGLHAHRVEVMSVSPTGGLPPRLRAWDDYVGLVGRLTTLGLIQGPKDLWWDVRPSAGLGTVEVRMCDMPQDLPTVLGLTALIQCLVTDLARRRPEGLELDECGLIIVRQNRWRAARFGLGADLVDPRTGTTSSARQVLKAVAGRLRPLGEELGCSRQLGSVAELADGPGGAGRQLAIFERTGDLSAVVRHMIGETPQAPEPPARAYVGSIVPVPTGLAFPSEPQSRS